METVAFGMGRKFSEEGSEEGPTGDRIGTKS